MTLYRNRPIVGQENLQITGPESLPAPIPSFFERGHFFEPAQDFTGNLIHGFPAGINSIIRRLFVQASSPTEQLAYFLQISK
jgi:hypothetical protein